MTTWTSKTRNSGSFTAKTRNSGSFTAKQSEAYFQIGGDYFLDIGSGYKIVIQPSLNGAVWTAKPRS